MDKRSEFNAALKEALKNKDKVALGTIRMMMAALKDRDIAAREHGNADGVPDGDILLMMQTMLKQRQESLKIYRDAGREDLAAQEEAEMVVIKSFMPRQLDDAEVAVVIEGLIAEFGAKDIKDMGRIMAVLKDKYAGQVDMGKAGAVAKQKLSA